MQCHNDTCSHQLYSIVMLILGVMKYDITLDSKITSHYNLITLLSKIFNKTTNEWEKREASFELLIPK